MTKDRGDETRVSDKERKNTMENRWDGCGGRGQRGKVKLERSI